MRTIALVFSTLMLATSAAVVDAAVYCVDTPTGLQNALDAAAASSANDAIRLQLGTYASTSAQGFRAKLTATGDLNISGGWLNGCIARARGQRSTIDGELMRPALAIIGGTLSRGLLRVTNLTFKRGVSYDSLLAGGLTANPYVNSDLDLEIESNRFSDNFVNAGADGYGAGLVAVSDGSLVIRNNVFVNNDASMGGGAARAVCSSGVAGFSNNTVIANTAAVGASNSIGGVYLKGYVCIWEVVNNIIRDNDGIDLALFVPDTVLRRNNLDEIGGSEPPGNSSGNLDVDPQFVGVNNFRLKRTSPMVDAGLDEPVIELPPFSYDGGPRVAGPHVDIGAYELDLLFADDFDPPFILSEVPLLLPDGPAAED